MQYLHISRLPTKRNQIAAGFRWIWKIYPKQTNRSNELSSLPLKNEISIWGESLINQPSLVCILMWTKTQWCVFNNSSLLGIDFFKSWPIPANSSLSESCHYLLKFTILLAFTQIKTLVWGGWQSCQGLTKNKNKTTKIFLWEKKTDVKVRYENSWLRKRSANKNVALEILEVQRRLTKILYICI